MADIKAGEGNIFTKLRPSVRNRVWRSASHQYTKRWTLTSIHLFIIIHFIF